MVPIAGFPDYFVDEDGNVYSAKFKKLRQLKPYVSHNGYLMIALLDGNGKRKKLLVHRLVGLAFIPNPLNLPEINHKDKNRANNRLENLEWCTRIDNLYDSYTTMSPVRNASSCEVFIAGKSCGIFESIMAAARYGKTNGYNYHSLSKYLICGDMKITPLNGTRRPTKEEKAMQYRGKRELFHNGVSVGVYENIADAAIAAQELFGVDAASLKNKLRNVRYGLEIRKATSCN